MKPLLPLCLMAFSAISHAQSLSLSINQAQTLDPWIKQNTANQQALYAQGEAANSWMNPKVSLMAANLPMPNGEADWGINNEGMTQIKASVSQMFPKAETLALTQQTFHQKAAGLSVKQHTRLANVELAVSKRWLNAFNTQQRLKIVKQNYQWFEQLLALSENNYRLGFRQTDSQDLVSAELQLLRLDDRILTLEQTFDQQMAQLSEYLPKRIEVSGEQLPDISQNIKQLNHWLAMSDSKRSAELGRHPSIVALDSDIDAQQTSIALAEAHNNAQWGVSASYAYRFDTPMGQNRADLFSVGVSVELPVFNQGKTEALKQAAHFKSESVRSKQALILNQLSARFEKATRQWRNNEQRLALYSTALLAKSSEQTESALNAYTNGEGQFKQVVSARILELDTQLKQLELINTRHLLLREFKFLMTQKSTKQGIQL